SSQTSFLHIKHFLLLYSFSSCSIKGSLQSLFDILPRLKHVGFFTVYASCFSLEVLHLLLYSTMPCRSIFLLAFLSLSCTVPHDLQVHSLSLNCSLVFFSPQS